MPARITVVRTHGATDVPGPPPIERLRAALHEAADALVEIVATKPPSVRSSDGLDDAVDAKAAAALLGVSPDWVRRHGDREGLAVKIGKRAVRYPRRRIAQYLRRQTASI